MRRIVETMTYISRDQLIRMIAYVYERMRKVMNVIYCKTEFVFFINRIYDIMDVADVCVVDDVSLEFGVRKKLTGE